MGHRARVGERESAEELLHSTDVCGAWLKNDLPVWLMQTSPFQKKKNLLALFTAVTLNLLCKQRSAICGCLLLWSGAWKHVWTGHVLLWWRDVLAWTHFSGKTFVNTVPEWRLTVITHSSGDRSWRDRPVMIPAFKALSWKAEKGGEGSWWSASQLDLHSRRS